jgi:hypothetical protein
VTVTSQHRHDQRKYAADHDNGHRGHDQVHLQGGEQSYKHPTGISGLFYALFVPHSHDAHDSIHEALEASVAGIRAVKISLLGLILTAILQGPVVIISDSVALLADTIHNLVDP